VDHVGIVADRRHRRSRHVAEIRHDRRPGAVAIDQTIAWYLAISSMLHGIDEFQGALGLQQLAATREAAGSEATTARLNIDFDLAGPL